MELLFLNLPHKSALSIRCVWSTSITEEIETRGSGPVVVAERSKRPASEVSITSQSSHKWSG